MSVRPSVRPSAWDNSPHTGRIFMNIFRKSIVNTPVSLKEAKRITGTLQEDIYLARFFLK
jgi:hypothetical protein